MQRRDFIKKLSAVGALGCSGALSACAGHFRGDHPEGVRRERDDGFLSDVASLPLGKSTIIYMISSRPVLLIKLSEDRVIAYESYCPHMACELNDGVSSQPVDVENGEIRCYLHDSYFDLETGERLRGPAKEGDKIPSFPIQIIEGKVYADRAALSQK